MTAATRFDASHTGTAGRRFDGVRGIRGRVHIPGSTRLIAATDGSWAHDIGGFGYVTYNGYWGMSARIMKGRLNPIRDHGTGSVVLELRAAGMAIEDFPGRSVRLLIDCTPAIKFLEAWQAGDVDRMPSGYSLRPRIKGSPKPALVRIAETVAGRDDLRFVHVRAHRGHPLNEVADSLAGIARHAVTNRRADEAAVGDRASALVSAFLHDMRGAA